MQPFPQESLSRLKFLEQQPPITYFHLSKGLSGNHPSTLCYISSSDLRHYLSLISIFLNSEKGRLGQSQEGGDIPVAFRRPGTLVWNAGLGSSQQQGI